MLLIHPSAILLLVLVLAGGAGVATTPPLLTVQPPLTLTFNVRTPLRVACAASGFPRPT